MNVEKEIMNWFSAKTELQIQSFKDIQRGAEICIYLCDISDNSDMKSQVQPGSNYDERQMNFELAKSLIEDLGLSFSYDIDKLSRLDKNEFIRFAQEVMSLEDDDDPIQYDRNQDPNNKYNNIDNSIDEEEEEKVYEEEEEVADEFDFDELFAELEEDLKDKLQKMHLAQNEIDDYGTERDFYLKKLMDIEKACAKYPKVDSDAVIKVLQLSSHDFAPASNEDSG